MRRLFSSIVSVLFLFISCYSELDIVNAEIDETDDGFPFSQSNQYRNSVALFGGSVAYSASICHSYWRDCLALDLDVYAASGAGFTIANNSIVSQVEKACSKKNYDLFLFWCSTNDYTRKAKIYSSDDNLDSFDSQGSGIADCIGHVLESNSHAKIVFFSSLKSFDAYGYSTEIIEGQLSLFQYVEGQMVICEQYGIPILDQFRPFPFNMDNYQSYYNDLIHPNDLGYETIKHRQALFLANVY